MIILIKYSKLWVPVCSLRSAMETHLYLWALLAAEGELADMVDGNGSALNVEFYTYPFLFTTSKFNRRSLTQRD